MLVLRRTCCRNPASAMASLPRLRLLPLLALLALVSAAHAGPAASPLFHQGERILFQGDSITDGNRGRTDDPNHILGHGYVFLIAARHGAAFPELGLTFINRGISGNRVADLEQRWETDTLALKPDVLSILVGINDALIGFWEHKPVVPAEFEATYDRILARARAANPQLKLVLGEPFILPGNHTREHWEEWQATMAELRAVVARLAAKYHAPVVHFQKIFDDACRRAPVEHWIWDGVHPTYSGHQLMADAWERVYREFYGEASADRPAR